jgi:site-specific recombinase XerD
MFMFANQGATMTDTTALLIQTDRAAIELVTNGLTSDHSKRAYGRALSDFLTWMQANRKPFVKATVQEYRQTLTGSPASVNLKMSAIRKLATEAADNGLIDQAAANGINRVQGVTSHGVRAGNWLTKNQAQQILNAPDIETLKGLRDRAILAVMIGAGLRRSEVAALTFDHIRQRDSRWVIVDMTGKGNRVRSVPIPSWVKLAIDQWAESAGITSGLVFQSIHKGGFIKHESMTPQAIRDVVNHYGEQIGIHELAAHDLRRTFAKLAHKGGAGLDQIQLSLGHASIKTTEKYLGVSQNLTDAPCDHLGLDISGD